MKPRLILSIGAAAGSAFGTAVYQLIRYGAYETGWARVLVIAVVTSTALLLVPRKWLEKPRP